MIKFDIQTNIENLKIEFIESVRAFFPFSDYSSTDYNKIIEIFVVEEKETFLINVLIDKKQIISKIILKTDDVLVDNREIKKIVKNGIYNYISKLIDYNLPYGSLTGVRPTKLYKHIENTLQNPREVLLNDYSVSTNKVNLIDSIVEYQKKFTASSNDIDLFINIPFCKDKCSYCSFASIEKRKAKDAFKEYINALKKDISEALSMLNDKKIRSIYVGGGTPTIYSASEIYQIFSQLKNIKPLEFTFESGRPDSITLEKLNILKEIGVTRISINPQTFKDSTLKLVNRTHSIDDIYSSFKIARDMGFTINMDLIALLPEESLEDFKESVIKCLALEPDDITVHSLSIKRGSYLSEIGYLNNQYTLAKNMIDFSIKELIKNNYHPYYLYRLKRMGGGLENIGYTKSATPCLYNIDTMEEECSILACGAGGISKIISNNSVRRYALSKDVYYYVDNIDDLIAKRKSFFKIKF